ncbi:hypothetical protein ACSVBT_12835 [Afipia sp. TerB]
MIAKSSASRGKPAAGRTRVRVTKPVKKKPVHKAAAKRVVKKTAAKTTAAKKTTKPKALPTEARFKKAVAFDAKPIMRVSRKAAQLVADDNDDVAKEKIAKAKARETKPRETKPRHSLITPSNHKRSAVERLDDPPPAPVAVMLGRVSIAIERELTQIERIVGGVRVKTAERTEAERRARTLASLARTLREVMQLRAGEEKKQDDDAVPRDIGEFRRQLARRLEQLAAEAKAAHPGTDHGP